MINLSDFILEKFKITKNIDTRNYTLLEKALDEEYVKNIQSPRILHARYDYKDEDKMQAYHDKGSKPERLVNSIKDGEKLFRRFCVAINMKWDDAINAFGEGLISRNIYKEDDIINFIAKRYVR